jgi:hypothetical protein
VSTSRRCLYCRGLYFPSIYRPQQVICSQPECQRRRKREYHRRKLETDAIYRQVVRDSQKQWWAEHGDYQRQRRQQRPALVKKNQEQQRERDRKRRLERLVRNNLALDLKRSAAEVWLLGPKLGVLDRNNLASAQVLILESVSQSPASCVGS